MSAREDADATTRAVSVVDIYKARFRKISALSFRLRVLGRRLVYALPWMRKRPFVALVQAMAAKLRNDPKALERALETCDPSAIAATARRHSCSAMLVEAVSALRVQSGSALRVAAMLQPVGGNVALPGMAIKAQLLSVVRMLSSAGVSFALLEDAARLYRDDSDAALHASGDFDILVPAAQFGDARELLRAQSYSERADEERQREYRDLQDHATLLFPPERGCAIKLHVGLAPPGWLSIPLDWDALASHLVTVNGPSGRVKVLDDTGAALHYAVQALGLHRLRDVVLLAGILARLGSKERTDLRATIAAERTDPIRLSSAVLLAARLAGVSWSADGSQEEYLRWVMRREDMPLFLGTRCQLAEEWFAADRRLAPLGLRLRSGSGAAEDKRKPALLATAGRIATSMCAFCYSCMMRPAT